jgi:hypothetical protein
LDDVVISAMTTDDDPSGVEAMLRSREQAVQLTYAVDDVRAAAHEWARRGAGPFFVVEHVALDGAWHGGTLATYDFSIAVGVFDRKLVGLIAVHRASPETLAAVVQTRRGLHHVGWFVDSIDASSRRLASRGWPCLVDAVMAGGERFVLHWSGVEGPCVKICEPVGIIASVYRRAFESSLGWDGADPVRELWF